MRSWARGSGSAKDDAADLRAILAQGWLYGLDRYSRQVIRHEKVLCTKNSAAIGPLDFNFDPLRAVVLRDE